MQSGSGCLSFITRQRERRSVCWTRVSCRTDRHTWFIEQVLQAGKLPNTGGKDPNTDNITKRNAKLQKLCGSSTQFIGLLATSTGGRVVSNKLYAGSELESGTIRGGRSRAVLISSRGNQTRLGLFGSQFDGWPAIIMESMFDAA